MKKNSLKIFIAALSWIILSCGSSSEEQSKSATSPMPTDTKAFVALKCTMCHFTDRIYTETRHPEKWRNIVRSMRLKNPTWISQEDADKILDYLLKNNSTPE